MAGARGVRPPAAAPGSAVRGGRQCWASRHLTLGGHIQGAESWPQAGPTPAPSSLGQCQGDIAESSRWSPTRAGSSTGWSTHVPPETPQKWVDEKTVRRKDACPWARTGPHGPSPLGLLSAGALPPCSSSPCSSAPEASSSREVQGHPCPGALGTKHHTRSFKHWEATLSSQARGPGFSFKKHSEGLSASKQTTPHPCPAPCWKLALTPMPEACLDTCGLCSLTLRPPDAPQHGWEKPPRHQHLPELSS